MEQIYVWTTRNGVHIRGDCHMLAYAEPEKTLVDDVGLKWPCKECFPEVARIRHVACQVCSPMTVRPCRHNGGVQVRVSPPKRAQMLVWTWPERALFVPVVGYGT